MTLDFGINADWDISLRLPYICRYHETIVDGNTDVSTSRSSAWGDARVLGRCQGLLPERN